MEHENLEDGGMNECGVVVVSDTEKRDGEVRTTSFISTVCLFLYFFYKKENKNFCFPPTPAMKHTYICTNVAPQ